MSVIQRMETDRLGLNHSTTTYYVVDLEQVKLSAPLFPEL